jgi:putative cardiolipin synthase
VRVRILTNSLAATDVGPVHAGYRKRREALLRAGVRLYEFKPAAAPPPTASKKGIAGSRAGSLHAKTFAIDGRRIFVGSFNFDPRSARLNTEMGVVIESRTLARRLVERLDRDLPAIAWEVRLRDDGALEWIDHGPAERSAIPRSGVHGDAPRLDPRNVAPSDRLVALTRPVGAGGVPSAGLLSLPRWAILRPLLLPPRPPVIPGSGAHDA